MIKFFIAFSFLFQFKTGTAQNVFHWKWQLIDNYIKITGKIDDGEEKEIVTDAAAAKKRFKRNDW